MARRKSVLAFFICEVVMRVPRFLKTKIGWALIIALAAAAGLKLTPEQKAAIEQHGPELATEIENAAND